MTINKENHLYNIYSFIQQNDPTLQAFVSKCIEHVNWMSPCPIYETSAFFSINVCECMPSLNQAERQLSVLWKRFLKRLDFTDPLSIMQQNYSKKPRITSAGIRIHQVSSTLADISVPDVITEQTVNKNSVYGRILERKPLLS